MVHCVRIARTIIGSIIHKGINDFLIASTWYGRDPRTWPAWLAVGEGWETATQRTIYRTISTVYPATRQNINPEKVAYNPDDRFNDIYRGVSVDRTAGIVVETRLAT